MLSALCAPPLRAELIPRQQGLQATLQEAVTAFEQADYTQAAEAFAALNETYSDEPAYQKLEPRLLPVWAHACRMNGDSARAAELYETFLQRYPDDAQQAPFVLFGLAQACQALGENARAADAYRRYRERFPDRPEALLSVLREADLSFSMGEVEPGIDDLLTFAASPRVPATLRAQARLRAVQAAQTYGDDARAADILLSEPWAITTMPELAVLAFASLRAGDHLASESRYDEAILAYRNVPPRQRLIDLQRNRLAQLEQIKRERTRRNPQGIQTAALWEEYFSGIIEKVSAELDQLVAMDNYTPAFQLRLGEAFLRAGRTREAGLLFGYLATDDTLSEALRSQAHYRWILCAQAREDWGTTLSRAESFHANFPRNPLIPATVYICADALIQRGDYDKATNALGFLIDGYPDSSQLDRWLFRRGYAQALAQDYPAAREDFTTLTVKNPDSPLSLRARLWIGLSYFFEYNYIEALEVFNKLTPDAADTQLEAEIAYRRAATLYSMRNYAATKQALNDFLERYPYDSHTPAARVLLGDTLMGMGELDAATEQFAQISPDAKSLYTYAIFQTGKIYRVSKNYDKIFKHFGRYLQTKPSKTITLPRESEARYWMAWSLIQQGKPKDGLEFLIVAILADPGNDPESGETSDIIQALESLYTQVKRGDITIDANNFSETAALLNADSFAQWLKDRYAYESHHQQLTRASRLALYLAKIYRRQGHTDRADALLFEIMERVPPYQLDAEGLATLGNTLLEHGFASAREYYLALLKDFPHSPRCGDGLYGLAQLDHRALEDESADKWLRRFEAETPFHRLAPQAALLHAQVLIDLKRTDEAKTVLTKSLQNPASHGRPQAEALLLLGEISAAESNPQEAIACDQRVYTLYRAWPDLLARAYWHSARMFEQIGDDQAALQTLVEMTDDPRLADTPEFTPALARRKELEAAQPPKQASAPRPDETGDTSPPNTEEVTP